MTNLTILLTKMWPLERGLVKLIEVLLSDQYIYSHYLHI